MIKMIVVDLDGTILDKNRKISERTIEYLKHLKNNGYIIAIATGRIYSSVLKVTKGAEFANYIISDTGACIYDTTNGNTILKNIIDKNIVEKLFEYYNKDFIYINVCNKNYIYKYSDKIENNNIIKTVKNKKYILDNCKEVSHISISMRTNKDVINLYDKISVDISNLDVLVMQDSFSDRKWIEILPKECSKYSSIKPYQII